MHMLFALFLAFFQYDGSRLIASDGAKISGWTGPNTVLVQRCVHREQGGALQCGLPIILTKDLVVGIAAGGPKGDGRLFSFTPGPITIQYTDASGKPQTATIK